MRFTFVLVLLVCLIVRAGLAAPVIVPDAPVMRLDEIGLYSVGYRYRGGPERRMPDGWSGFFEERTGVACEPAGEQNGRQAFLLHCPWRGGTGVTFQEFAFRLPRARRIELRGATAMRADIVGKSDGATFRVYVNGEKRLDVNRADAAWQPFRIDLTRLGGSTVVIRFETDPGPKNDPSFDYSLWGGRELVLEGYRPVARAHPDPPRLDLRAATAGKSPDVVPPDEFHGTRHTALEGDTVVFQYTGADGTLEYRWRRPEAPGDPPLGRIALRARMRGDAPVEAPLAGSSSIEWTEPAMLLRSEWKPVSGGYLCACSYRVGAQEARLNLSGRMVGKSLILDAECDKPLIRAFDAGGWGPVLRRRKIAVPYFSGSVYYLPAQNLFVNTILDWTVSSASSHDGARANYGALTDGSRNRLREAAVYTASWHIEEALPGIPNPPSPYLKQVGGRIVLDSWGGRFTDVARSLEKLADYGLREGIALIHVWQRSGYDNALPAHIPANAEQGGDEGMKTLVSTGTRLGYLMALHENYVDYYPNYEGFKESDIALDSSGKRVPAWFNPGTKIQSFAVKPNAILPLARTQSSEIHRRYETNADYLDVHSAVPPWFHVDFRAGEEGAGTFHRVWDAHRALWAFERATHRGPVFGEGANHWYWSGCLDGVEAQFGVGWPANQGPSAPLMVDFDLLRIHPLQCNHGMGYYER